MLSRILEYYFQKENRKILNVLINFLLIHVYGQQMHENGRRSPKIFA